MYDFVNKSEVNKYTSYCADKLNQLKQRLEFEDIEIQVELIGSGAKGLVTRNGNAPFDLDYNIIINELPCSYEKNLKTLKNLIREELDDIVGINGKDSTSALTYHLHYPDKTRVKFKFDVGIIKANQYGKYCRLIHDKQSSYCNIDGYIWNEMPNSNNLYQKIDEIKKNGYWHDVRNTYLDKKNMYLSRQDRSHQSFNIYIETINEIYSKINRTNWFF